MSENFSSLNQNTANYVPLNPVSFLKRAGEVFPKRNSIIYDNLKFTWFETLTRCRLLASAIQKYGLRRGEVVGFLAMNTPELYEAHFGVPMAGMVLNALNYRLDSRTIAYIIDHSEIKLLVVDSEFVTLIGNAIAKAKNTPQIIFIDDPFCPLREDFEGLNYEEFLASGDPNFLEENPDSEWDSISINYTSGTTGNPKGVVYHYRGAYLNALGNTVEWDMASNPVYLWTLPMFHCNGWCFPWTIAAKGGTNICLRKVTAEGIYDAISNHGVNHLCGAPTVLGLLVNASNVEKQDFSHTCKVMTAAAPPPAAVLQSMEEMGFEVTHVYGLTEVYGPCVVCVWDPDWNKLSKSEKASLKSRQGVNYVVQDGLRVVMQDSFIDVPKDGKTIGEVLLRGNVTMKGYLKDRVETEKVFSGGWFHTGDLGVIYPDGYIQLKDRLKDIIISGGENISSIEIENCLYDIPGIAACAVVAMPDDKWGEVPCAFIEIKPGIVVDEIEILAHCRDQLAQYKIPKKVVFKDLPKTSTGKIQKMDLRSLIIGGN